MPAELSRWITEESNWSKFSPLIALLFKLHAPGSKFSNAFQIIPVRQIHERKKLFFWKSGPDWHFNLKLIGRDLRFWAIQPLQKPPFRPQSVEFWSLTHHWMRQGQYFLAHFELAPYSTSTTVWQPFCELCAKTVTLCTFGMLVVYYFHIHKSVSCQAH